MTGLALAQQGGPIRTPRARGAKSEEAVRARLTKAIDLLRETASRSRTIDDLFYRARLQMLAANALWPFDEQSARAIFQRSWEAATAADKAEQEEETAESDARPEKARTQFTESRREVLLKAAARDRLLAERFLKDLWDEEGELNSATQNQSLRRTRWHNPDPHGAQRLALALELLNEGHSEHAAQLARPLVRESVSADFVLFLIRLREQNTDAADALYRQLIESTKTSADADVNTVLLLSSYIISPNLLVVVDQRGSLQFRPIQALHEMRKTSNPPPVSQPTRSAFYHVAANVLLRPFASRAGASPRSEAVALYFAIGRLLPFFEREATQHVSLLYARRHALLNEINADQRETLSTHFDLRTLINDRRGDPLKSQVEKLAQAQRATERDHIRLRIVNTAARLRLWDRARRTAETVEDLGVRRMLLSYIAVSQIADISRAYADDEENDYESVLKFISSADAPPLASAWGYAQAAEIAARKKERQRAAEILTEAEQMAARVARATPQSVAAYAVVATSAARVDTARSWELLREVVKAANSTRDYRGEEITLEIVADEGLDEDDADSFSITSEAFRLDRIFATMARLDFEKALAEAHALENDVKQAVA
ncbi:MAG: hypothetical protein ICV68_11220, partial [Pyrinomonadaceae bacterium]|nr:hypothetical protein [Pyrinomonadaceae bacterium]